MNLFERLILQEAPNPPQPNPEEEGQQPPNFVDGPEAQESAPEDPNAGQPEDAPPQDGGGEAPDQPDMNMGAVEKNQLLKKAKVGKEKRVLKMEIWKGAKKVEMKD